MMVNFLKSAIGIVVFLAQQACAEELNSLSVQDRKNYEIGVQFVRTLSNMGGEINLDIVIKGMRDTMRGENMRGTGKNYQGAAPTRHRTAITQRQTAEIGSDAGGIDAAARMTLGGGVGRITVAPGPPALKGNPHGYRYPGARGRR